MTNGDKIRQMSDKELLDFLDDYSRDACNYCDYRRGSYDCKKISCEKAGLEWLEGDVKQ